MKVGDTQLGAPSVLYTNTKANIEALSGVVEGAVAYATDTDRFGAYTGSAWRWYSPRVLLPFGVYASLSPMTVDSSPYGATISRTTTFIKWTQSLAVVTTNDGSNYWKLRLTDNAGNLIKEINTSALAVNTWGNLSTTSFDIASVGAADLNIKLTVVKQGSPGSLYMVGPELEVELA